MRQNQGACGMKNIQGKRSDNSVLSKNPSSSDLRGQQSVRATFRLSEACINAISILSAHLGIKQKSVIDHLMEDAQILKDMAKEIHSDDIDQHERIQKTFVISRRSLTYLDMISSEHDAPRDALLEHSVRRLFPIVRKEQVKHEKRKELLDEISNHFAKGEKLLSKANEMVGENDPVFKGLDTVMATYKNALDDIESFIAKGKLIEELKTE
jgi:predicted transcriptional regulator